MYFLVLDENRIAIVEKYLKKYPLPLFETHLLLNPPQCVYNERRFSFINNEFTNNAAKSEERGVHYSIQGRSCCSLDSPLRGSSFSSALGGTHYEQTLLDCSCRRFPAA